MFAPDERIHFLNCVFPVLAAYRLGKPLPVRTGFERSADYELFCHIVSLLKNLYTCMCIDHIIEIEDVVPS